MKISSLARLATGLMLAAAACSPTVRFSATLPPAIPSPTPSPAATSLASATPTLTPTPQPIGNVQRETDVIEHGSAAGALAKLLGTAALFQGDVLKLHDGGEGLLDFGNQMQLRLFNNTQMGIVSASAPNTPLDIELYLIDGGFTGQLTAPGGQVVFTTPVGAQITVLGTEFFVAYNAATQATSAGNFHGTVLVKSGGVQIALAASNSVVVPPGQPPGVQLPIVFTVAEFQQQARSLKSPVSAAIQNLTLAGSAALSVGDGYVCALTRVGGVKCWGNDNLGQLGDGMTVTSPLPVDVIGLTDAATGVAAGNDSGCAVLQSGQVECWGSNDSGQLGANIVASQSLEPVPVNNLSGAAIAVTSGHRFSCALTAKGGVQCWGDNGFGQFGDGSLESGVLAISAGSARDHTCALMRDGGVKCWGLNHFGELGSGPSDGSSTPLDVAGLSGPAVSVATGESHSCLVTPDGGVKCWGDDSYGQLGSAAGDTTPTPVDVQGLATGVVAVAAGVNHTCALTAVGGVKCWGDNALGQLGDATNKNSSMPVDVHGLTTGVMAISAGKYDTCALMISGGVKCWGDDTYGQLGDGTTEVSNVPVDVIGLGP